MLTWRLLRIVMVIALSGAAGWALNDQMRGEPIVPLQIPVEATVQSSGTKPAVVLFEDGTVTIQVQRRPVQWLLDEIARVGGGRFAALAHPDKSVRQDISANSAACVEPVPTEASERESVRILQAINDGSEDARYQGLLSARSHGEVLSEAMLKTLIDTDASERVRMIAFETYLESKSGNPHEVRTVLEAALSNPSGKIQMEAKKLLEQFEELERIDTNNPQLKTQ